MAIVVEETADVLSVAGREGRERAARVEPVGAARGEWAAGRNLAEPRDDTVDGVQAGRGVLAGNRRQESPGVGVLWRPEERAHGRGLDHAARVHHQHAIRALGDDAEVVRDEEEGEVEAGLEVAQEVEDLAPES